MIVGCSESTYIHTQIHSDSKETEGPLFYYYMFICASFGSKISGFQKKMLSIFTYWKYFFVKLYKRKEDARTQSNLS